MPFFGLGGGWFLYLVFGYGYRPRSANHFNPWDPMFARHVVPCAVSVACWAAFVAFVLAPYSSAFGLAR